MIPRAQKILREEWVELHSRRDTPEGIERRCLACHEWWPEDREFFTFISTRNTYHPECKACRSDKIREKRLNNSERAA